MTRKRAKELLSAAETARHSDGKEYRISLVPGDGLMTEPADLYMAPVPRCELHGPMRYVPAVSTYVCHGFYGEGCHATDPADLDWTYVGKTEGGITFTAPLDSPNARIALGGTDE